MKSYNGNPMLGKLCVICTQGAELIQTNERKDKEEDVTHKPQPMTQTSAGDFLHYQVTSRISSYQGKYPNPGDTKRRQQKCKLEYHFFISLMHFQITRFIIQIYLARFKRHTVWSCITLFGLMKVQTIVAFHSFLGRTSLFGTHPISYFFITISSWHVPRWKNLR